MSVIIFIIILTLLVLVHELGHFIVAKRSGIRVDEFGLGFPPRLISRTRGETTYSLNAIPFGGFVKIFGENGDEGVAEEEKKRSFVHMRKRTQIAVLIAGVAANILFAWILISFSLMVGFPTTLTDYNGPGEVRDPRLLLTYVEKDSPAEKAGLHVGDHIISMSEGSTLIQNPTSLEVQKFIAESGGREVEVTYKRRGDAEVIKVTPIEGVIPDRLAVGIMMETVGTVTLSPVSALWQGAKKTALLTGEVTQGLFRLVTDALRFRADLSQVTGPVGIASMVGDVAGFGFTYLLTFTALISVNLAVINLIPFPALDGGRILFVIIEKIRGVAINPKIANALNGIGFVFLILLMLVITYRDIIRLLVRS